MKEWIVMTMTEVRQKFHNFVVWCLRGYIDNSEQNLQKESLQVKSIYPRDLRLFWCCHRIESIHFRRQISLSKIELISFCRVKYILLLLILIVPLSLHWVFYHKEFFFSKKGTIFFGNFFLKGWKQLTLDNCVFGIYGVTWVWRAV